MTTEKKILLLLAMFKAADPELKEKAVRLGTDLIAEINRLEHNYSLMYEMLSSMPCAIDDMCPGFDWGDE